MSNYIFIHGSSVGQSILLTPDAPSSICNDLSNKYFQGRIPRQQKSGAKLSMFVDLYKTSSGEAYCAYSFVNNECYGSNGREGQYFALTILCKDVFYYPEDIYHMLHSAYSQMYSTGNILRPTDSNDQFVIAQFSEKKEYLTELLKKVLNTFNIITEGQGRQLKTSNIGLADYDSWEGIRVNIENCNSSSSYADFCKVGRLYISEEYESYSDTIKGLKNQIDKLKTENDKIAQSSQEAKRLEKSKVREELEDISKQLKEKDAEINRIQKENESFKASIDVVTEELKKFEKSSRAITNLQNKKGQYQEKGKKDILKTSLLFLLLILTVLSAGLNYCFFRDLSSSLENKKVIDETSKQSEQTANRHDESSQSHSDDRYYLNLSQQAINVPASGGEYQITIESNPGWEVQNSTQRWVSFSKSAENCLKVTVAKNSGNTVRELRFSIKAGTNELQVRVQQDGQVSQPSTTTDYGVTVKDEKGNVLKNGSNIYPGQSLTATASKPSMSKTGYGWKYSKCTGITENQKEVNVKITGNVGESAIISYGNLNDSNQRQRFTLKIVERPSTSVDEKSAPSNVSNADASTNGASATAAKGEAETQGQGESEEKE